MSSDDFFSTRVIKDKGELNNGVVYYLFVENFMDLKLELELARKYKSNSQKARILTETWVAEQIYCPSCGNPAIRRFKANRPVADFYCETCQEIYELKSKKSSIGKTLADGAYQTKIERLLSETNPNLFILTYDTGWSVTNFITIPKQFFVPSLIEKRKPLPKTARRAGWQGSNIIISDIPEMGKIYVIKNSSVLNKTSVLKSWDKSRFLSLSKNIESRGWTLDVLKAVEKINQEKFALDDVYKFEGELSSKHPENKHVRDKIRQQLQVLRDEKVIEFIARGKYRIIT